MYIIIKNFYPEVTMSKINEILNVILCACILACIFITVFWDMKTDNIETLTENVMSYDNFVALVSSE